MKKSNEEKDVTATSVSATRQEKLWLYNFKQILLILLAAFATATSVEIFLLPSNVVVGGVLGISSILDILLADGGRLYFSVGVWVIALNIPIFIYCYIVAKRRFVIKTMLYVVFLGIFLIAMRLLNLSDIFENLMYGDDEKDKVIYVVLGGALHGISLPLMLSVSASTGGSDIVGIMVQKSSNQSSSIAMRIILLTNVAVVLVSSVVYYFTTGNASEAVNMFIYSVAAMFICEIVQESIFKGFSAALELEITTDKPDEMIHALQSGLKRGTTNVKVIGGYTHAEKSLILCVVNKQQLTHARRIINQVDPQAFAYVEKVKEVLGQGFSNKEVELDGE